MAKGQEEDGRTSEAAATRARRRGRKQPPRRSSCRGRSLTHLLAMPMPSWSGSTGSVARPHTRRDAAKAALPYEKARPVTCNEGGEAPKVRSELEIGRRLAFVFELIARGEVKAKMPKGAPLFDGLEVPERDLAGREFATSQIASHCGSSKVDENREPQAKTEPAVRE